MSKVIIHRHAAKYLHRLPGVARERVKGVLRRLEQRPLEYPGVKSIWQGNGLGITEYARVTLESCFGLMKPRMSFTWITSAHAETFTNSLQTLNRLPLFDPLTDFYHLRMGRPYVFK
jgi:hypothetical protein